MSDAYDAENEAFDTEIDDEIEDEIDDAGEGDEAEGEVGDDGAEEGQGEGQAQGDRVAHDQVRRPSRAQARVELALREAREAKAELASLRAAQTNTQTADQRRQAEAQERTRLAEMDPEQRLEYLLNQQGQRHQADLQTLRFEMQDSSDRTAYEGLCTRSPVATKLKDEVETRLRELRANGQTAPRETVLKFLIGERALTNAGRAKGKAQRIADTNKQRQTARVGSARGDATETGRRGGDDKTARAKRLENMQI